MKTFANKITATCFATLAFAVAGSASADPNYTKIPNAGIPGHNQESFSVSSAESCMKLCDERDWCKSADFERAKGSCFLQPVSRNEASLRTDYPGNPYDHYQKNEHLHETVTSPPASVAAPSTKGSEQCGERVAVVGVGSAGLIYAARKARAERRAERAWRAFVGGADASSTVVDLIGGGFLDTNHPSYGLGTRYADLDKAQNVVINCDDGSVMKCTVTATPCAW